MIEDETSVLREVLLGPPENFEWLPTSAISKAALASGVTLTREDVLAAHGEMVAAYDDAGVTTHTLPADEHLPYQVFSRDSSVWGATGPIVTQLHQSWRRGEYAPVLDFYAAAGIEVAHKITAGSLEGGDLVLPAARTALIGHCEERTEGPAARQLAGGCEAQGWQVRLQPFDPHFVHIDVIVNVVAPGLAVICAEAAPPGLHELADRAGPGADRGVLPGLHGPGRERDVPGRGSRGLHQAGGRAERQAAFHGADGVRPRPVAVHDGRRRPALPGPAARAGLRRGPGARDRRPARAATA